MQRILTRKNLPTDELSSIVEIVYKCVKLLYTESYYIDCLVSEETGNNDKSQYSKHYTKDQMERNLLALKNAYYVAKGTDY